MRLDFNKESLRHAFSSSLLEVC